MAPTFIKTIRSVASAVPAVSRSAVRSAAYQFLAARDDDKDDDRHVPEVDPSFGVLDPHDISNVGFFVLFALIGVGIVCTGIWFFFWAKNGGFYFEEQDWDDYKTTVLRRKGPNGTILSGATESTNLGGGSVYKDVEDDGQTVITESTALSGITAGASDIGAREKRERKRQKREKERAKRDPEGKKRSRRHVGDEGVEDTEAEQWAKKELRNYRGEKAARVGGLNKEADGSEWDGSTNPTDSTVSSTLLSDRTSEVTSTPPRSGIRKVYSVADRRAERESERMRAEARRVREQQRQSRRDFSWQHNSSVSESLLESTEGSGLGTKSYHHPLPELRELERERDRTRDRADREKAREERRARRQGGYRRGRGEDYDG